MERGTLKSWLSACTETRGSVFWARTSATRRCWASVSEIEVLTLNFRWSSRWGHPHIGVHRKLRFLWARWGVSRALIKSSHVIRPVYSRESLKITVYAIFFSISLLKLLQIVPGDGNFSSFSHILNYILSLSYFGWPPITRGDDATRWYEVKCACVRFKRPIELSNISSHEPIIEQFWIWLINQILI